MERKELNDQSGAFSMQRFTVEKQKHRTKRGDLLDEMLAILNPSRAQAGYPALTHSRLSRMLKDAGKNDYQAIYALHQNCLKNGKPYGALFHFLTRKHKDRSP